MTDVETLEERVRTVERAVTDGDHDVPAVEDRAELDARLTAVEDRLDRLDERTAELEAATQALRGYVGNIRSVNEAVEQRADAALAVTERLEGRLDDALDGGRPSSHPSEPSRTTTGRSSGHREARETSLDAAGEDQSPRSGVGQATPVADGGESERATPDGGVLERIRALL